MQKYGDAFSKSSSILHTDTCKCKLQACQLDTVLCCNCTKFDQTTDFNTSTNKLLSNASWLIIREIDEPLVRASREVFCCVLEQDIILCLVLVPCAEPDSFARGGPTLTTFFFSFLVDEGRKDPNTTISWPPSADSETPCVPMLAQH